MVLIARSEIQRRTFELARRRLSSPRAVKEVDRSRNGTAPHSAWRNYDDINEYFWTRGCSRRIKWPLNLIANFFAPENDKRIGKTGFVEQRTFWNIFRSFDKLWVLLIVYFQAAVIFAWDGNRLPWKALENPDVQAKLLLVFITWSGLRLLQSVLDAGTQYSLVCRETLWLGVRMVLKSVVAMAWIIVFSVFYARIWSQKTLDGQWSAEANQKIFDFLWAVFVFVTPEMLALLLFILPWVRNVIEQTDWPILYFITWWFHTFIFVGQRAKRGPCRQHKYSLFWVVMLAWKFTFSYFLQIQPLIEPTKTLSSSNITYWWHEFFGGENRIALFRIWVHVVLVYLMDLQIWYSIFSSLVGAATGLFSHLGEIQNSEQLRLRFQFFASAMQFNLMAIDETSRL